MIKKFILCVCDFGGINFLSVIGRDKVAYFWDENYSGKIVDGIEVIYINELEEIHKVYKVVPRTYFREFWNSLHEKFHVMYILCDSLQKINQYKEYLEIFTAPIPFSI